MKKILIIGATSAIAEHYARIEAAAGSSFFLAGRSTSRLGAISADLQVRGGVSAGCHTIDLNDLPAHPALLDAAWEFLGGVDIVLLAHGTLPDHAACQADVDLALREFSTNAVSGIVLMTSLAERMAAQGSGTLAVISSVAGDRGRASNCLYGSAKAAITAYASGLRQRLWKEGVNVLTIKPGFVDTPMTAGFRKNLLWAQPESVAKGIVRAIDQRRAVVYLPAFWWPIMKIITHIPESIFRRLSL